jgi:hypothetical protein
MDRAAIVAYSISAAKSGDRRQGINIALELDLVIPSARPIGRRSPEFVREPDGARRLVAPPV